MELLFKREQTPGRFTKVQFKLWGKIELDAEEQAIIDRYSFADSILIAVLQPKLIRNSIIVAVIAFLAVTALMAANTGLANAVFVGLLVGAGAGYFYLHERRETIYVKDLLHGRYFTCSSVIELARKEAWLQTIVAFLRQVMETAKHWDGTEHHPVKPLPSDEARKVIIQGV